MGAEAFNVRIKESERVPGSFLLVSEEKAPGLVLDIKKGMPEEIEIGPENVEAAEVFVRCVVNELLRESDDKEISFQGPSDVPVEVFLVDGYQEYEGERPGILLEPMPGHEDKFDLLDPNLEDQIGTTVKATTQMVRSNPRPQLFFREKSV